MKNLYDGKNLNIGILGGTFNPVHLGHLYMAKQAKKHLNLDRVVFMVCANPPHKNLAFDTSPLHRLKMLQISIKGYENFIIDDFEAKLKTKAYTYKSLIRINKEIDEKTETYFIIGADSLMQLDFWREPEKLMELTKFAVIPRGDFSKDECMKKIDFLKRTYDANIEYINCDKMNISSTLIRGVTDQEKTKLLDIRVQEYIKKNRLYGND